MRSLEFAAVSLHSVERGEGLEVAFVTDRAYVRKPSKNPGMCGLGSFQVSEHIHYQGGDVPQLCGNRGFYTRDHYVSLHRAVHLHPLLCPLINWFP